MIMNTSAGTSVLSQIETSPFHFFLTGSQFFGNAGKDSDHDFFVEEDDRLYDWLEGLRFEMQGCDYGADWREMGYQKRCSMLPSDHALDPTIKEVWLYKGKGRNVHIQVIRKDMIEVKKIAQDIIKKNNLLSLAPRENFEWKMNGAMFTPNPNYKALSKAIWVSVIRSVISLRGRG